MHTRPILKTLLGSARQQAGSEQLLCDVDQESHVFSVSLENPILWLSKFRAKIVIVDFLAFPCGSPAVLLRFSCGSPAVLLRFSCGSPVVY